MGGIIWAGVYNIITILDRALICTEDAGPGRCIIHIISFFLGLQKKNTKKSQIPKHQTELAHIF